MTLMSREFRAAQRKCSLELLAFTPGALAQCCQEGEICRETNEFKRVCNRICMEE